MMWMAWLFGGVLLIVVGTVFAVGALLPREHIATGSVLIAHAPEEIWRVIRRVEELPAWRKSVTRVEIIEGPPESPTAWREYSGRDAIPLRLEQSTPSRSLTTRIMDEKLPFGGTWTIDLTPDGSGTRVRVTENGFVNPPPFRFIAKFFMGHAATLRGYLADLARKFGTESPIEP